MWLHLSCVAGDHGYVPLVMDASRSFPHSWLVTGFVVGFTRRVSLVKRRLLTLHLYTPGFWWGSRYSIFGLVCVFCRSLFVLLSFCFWPLCCLFFFFWPLCCLFFFFWPLCCLFFFFWPLCCLFFFDLQILITTLGIFKLFLQTKI